MWNNLTAGWGVRLALLAIPALLLSLTAGVHANTVTWIGAAVGDWDAPANWSGGAVPSPADDAVATTAAVQITHSAGDTAVASLTLTGTLRLTGGSLTLSRPSLITGQLFVEPGAALRVTGAGASLTVTGNAAVRGGSVLALDGAAVSLPGATQYAGSGLLSAQGPGSLLELSGLSNIGIPTPLPLTDIGSAVSREFSLFVQPPDLPLADMRSAVSRELSVFVSAASDGEGLAIRSAASREVSVFVGAQQTRELPTRSAVSREVSIQNQAP